MLQPLLAFVALSLAPVTQFDPVISDPPADAVQAAGVEAFVLPSHGAGMNALLYTASGAGPHPTLLLLHGFPGNEQNLDLAQAARRAGWNVLTLHYRGSWGSGGAFSFTNAAQDARAALAFLFDPATAAKYAIDTRRVAVAGHSMGGFMAADAAADEPRVAGLFLIDPWDISTDAKRLGTKQGRAAWNREAAGDLPPLAGTSAAKLAAEMQANASRLDLTARARAFGKRPIDVIGAERGFGAPETALLDAIRAGGNSAATGALWATDHSFSDHRIALAQRLVRWLAALPSR